MTLLSNLSDFDSNDTLLSFCDTPVIFIEENRSIYKKLPHKKDYFYSIKKFEFLDKKLNRPQIILQLNSKGDEYTVGLAISPLDFRNKNSKPKRKKILAPGGHYFNIPSKAFVTFSEINFSVLKVTYILFDITDDNGNKHKLYIPSFMKKQIEHIKKKAIEQELLK
jgi:hypothetical protein